MRTLTLSAVLLLTLPAFSEEPAAPAPELATPWSVGAGLGFGTGDFISGATVIPVMSPSGLAGLSSLGAVGVQTVPRVSFERRLSERLALGGSLSIGGSSEKSSWMYTGPYLNTSWSGAAAIGPRWTLTEATAPVAVLAYVDALGGLSSSNYSLAPAEPVELQGFSLGLAGGLGVERVLVPNLSLRIQAQLARVAWTRTFMSGNSQQSAQYSTSFRASAAPSAFAELRLAF